MADRVVHVVILGVNCTVAALQMLVSRSKSFIARILLVSVPNLASDDVNFLIIVFVLRASFSLALSNGRKSFHASRLESRLLLSEMDATLHYFLLGQSGSGSLKAKPEVNKRGE
jgi:hypothetical protein